MRRRSFVINTDKLVMFAIPLLLYYLLFPFEVEFRPYEGAIVRVEWEKASLTVFHEKRHTKPYWCIGLHKDKRKWFFDWSIAYHYDAREVVLQYPSKEDKLGVGQKIWQVK